MNKNYRPAASVSLGTSSYKSPTITVVDIISEGVLCASGQHEGWFEDDLDW